MKPFTFSLRTKIVFGRGGLIRVGDEAARLGDRCLLVTGRSFAKRSGYLNTLVKILEEPGLKITVFDKVEPNPSIETVYKGAEEGLKNNCNLVVAFGGGSAMDAAKGMAFLLKSNARLEDNLAPKEVEEAVPVIAIPSTCGTGSEVTKYAVLTNVSRKRKEVLLGDAIVPRVAILDADVLNSLSEKLVAYTGFDALSHALEAYTSNDSTPFSDLLALEALQIIFGNIIGAFEGSPEARENMLYASMLAGVAINCAGTEIVHAMGYYLTNYHEVHHGLANGMMLPHAMKLEIQKGFGKLDDAASKLGLENGMELVKKIEYIADKIGIPKSLRELGVSESELDAMVADALSYWRNLNRHPFPPTPEDMKKLYLMAFSGRASSM
ncbi:MAG: iron-containing alcohol dehydrogenase [Thermoproteota archaeon]|nr:iron-containing alcohol dehydrogenase [Candidatus Brockarchaeota archaeon]